MNLLKSLSLVLIVAVIVVSISARAESSSGKYRCWSMNVGGYGGGRCTSPALLLNSNGTYVMGSEKGTYSTKGNQLILSQSKIRGPGRFQENGNQIVFEYAYNGKNYTITYLRLGDAPVE